MEQPNLIPKRRFKEFQYTHDWEQHKLGDGTSKIGDGLHGTPGYTENGEVAFINGNNLVNGNIVINNQTNFVTSKQQSKNDTKLNNNTILMSINGTIGNLAYYNGEKIMLGKSAAFIEIKSFNKKFIYQLLQTYKIRTHFLNSLTGSTIKNLGLKIIRETIILVPKTDEQEKIGSYLEGLDDTIALHQRKLEKVKALKSAYLSEMFPVEEENEPKRRFAGFNYAWEQKAVSDLADRYDNLRIPITASDRVTGDTPYYGANGIQGYVEGFTHNGEFILVAEDGANDLQKYPIQYVNRKIWVNNHAHVLQAKAEVADNKFLMNAMKHLNIESYLVGGGRAKLNADVMMKINFQVPELAEQKLIGSFFANLDHLIVIQQRKLEKMQNIKKAYLNEMFV